MQKNVQHSHKIKESKKDFKNKVLLRKFKAEALTWIFEISSIETL